MGAGRKKPNLLFVFADQWRAQAFGYAGDPNARTPNIDRFSSSSVNFGNAVSGCPVCCPYRASLQTGQGPLTHGVFLNDVSPRFSGPAFAEALASGGYETAYIGKWHSGGGPRLEPTPREFRRGFKFWRALECSHDYNDSIYYTETGERRRWSGYDAEAQTKEAVGFMKSQAASARPFALFLSWAPPHEPYGTAPSRFRAFFDESRISLRPNVPKALEGQARRDLAGYYAHGAALDSCFGSLLRALDELRLSEDTIVVFTSDHGDMLHSHGMSFKQRPWDESVRVPFLLRLPSSKEPSTREEAIDAPDIMPTILSLCGLPVPSSVEGKDLSASALGGPCDENALDAFLLHVYAFHQCFGWDKAEWRAVRTPKHTYAVAHEGPWLLYDNVADPFQTRNLAGEKEFAVLQRELDAKLRRMLAARKDAFLKGAEYVKSFGHALDARGDATYFNYESERQAFFTGKGERP